MTGPTTQNGALLQIPKLSLSVTFPGTNRANKTVPPRTAQDARSGPGRLRRTSPSTTRATLFLSTGTYFFNNWTVEPRRNDLVHAPASGCRRQRQDGFIFRGTIIEKNPAGDPKLFVGVFGTSQSRSRGRSPARCGAHRAAHPRHDLTTARGHSGAFYAKGITVNPDNTITHFPFAGPPTPTST